MSDSEVDYLQSGFDPKSLTVPRLRSILVTYNINYPSTAKKPQLIELFNDHVVPQSRKILAQRARAKRSSMGIVDAVNSQSTSTVSMDEADLALPPPRATRTRSPRKSSRINSESVEPESLPETRASPRKRQLRSVSRQLSDTDTTDVEVPRSIRSVRTKTPQIQIKEESESSEDEEEEEVTGQSSADDDEVFTTDNPFQSGGSSPPAAAKTPSNRRRTTEPEYTTGAAASKSRRRTDGPIKDAATSSSKVSRSFEIPLTRAKRPVTPSPESEDEIGGVEAGEEFTPEEQLELTQQEAERGSQALVRRPKKKSGMSVGTPIWVLVCTLLSAYAAWYRQEKLAVGYCGLGRPSNSIIPDNVQLPEWMQNIEMPQAIKDIQLPSWAATILEPQCEPCPPHAYCYQDFVVRCENDYIEKPHPLSLGGAVPLPPTCEPDGEKVRRVKVVADKAVEELRDRRAKFECGELKDEEGVKVETPAVEEQVLKDIIDEKRSKKLSKQEFDDLWVAALGDIEAREEIEVEEVETAARTPGSDALHAKYVSSSSLAGLPLSCALRRSIRHTIARYRLYVSALVGLLITSLYGRSRYRSYVTTRARIPALVDTVLERLASQKELSYEGNPDDTFLFLPNLRDDVLRATHRLKDRERIWQSVRAVVEQNSNVRTGQREGSNGEVGRAWEWIGPTNSGENNARRRRSGRVSLGPEVTIYQDNEDVVKPPASEMAENRSALHRKWQESRPIY